MSREGPARQAAAAAGKSSGDVVRINVAGTKYGIVSVVAEELAMVPVDQESDSRDCHVHWIDAAVPLDKFLEMKSYQRINHFPGMGEICRKDSLARNAQRMLRVTGAEYSFVPVTWVLPAGHNSLCCHIRELKRRRRTKTFIVKPHNGSMGNGISLVRSAEQIPTQQTMVVQEYVDKPFLLDSFKCDLRLYVLVTACNPLRIFVYKDGLVRLSTQAYTPPTDENIGDHFMHLTNYSVNKHSSAFNNDEGIDKGSKRTLKYFSSWLSQNGYNVAELWARVHDVIIKTLIMAHPNLVHSYQACRPGSTQDNKCQFFEILGFDVLLDHTLRPWLLEVNRSPSFSTDAQLDMEVKKGVLRDALRLANISPTDKKEKLCHQKAASRRRLWHTQTRSARYNFLAEQEIAASKHEQRKVELKEQLLKLRQVKELEEHEEENMGDYVRVYPTYDAHRARVYETLLKASAKVSFIGKAAFAAASGGSYSSSIGMHKMKEHELMELLSQCEDEEKGLYSPSWLAQRSSVTCYQPLSAVQQSSLPMDSVYAVMEARVAEEEHTQRTMIALNEMKPSYPGKQSQEVQRILEEVKADMKYHKPRIDSFWLVTLDSERRKQLLAPVREAINSLLHCYWRKAKLDSVRLHTITSRLLAFLLSHSGQVLCSSFEPLGESWEAAFKQKSEVISMVEMVCCRRIVAQCQSMAIAGYYYHHHRPTAPSRGPRTSPAKYPSARDRKSVV